MKPVNVHIHSKPIMVGYKCGIDKPPTNNKSPALTTEMAHRTNSYGLLHILVYEELLKNEHTY